MNRIIQIIFLSIVLYESQGKFYFVKTRDKETSTERLIDKIIDVNDQAISANGSDYSDDETFDTEILLPCKCPLVILQFRKAVKTANSKATYPTSFINLFNF